MDKLCRALSFKQNKDSKKNKEIMVSEKNEKSLKEWKLPPSSASDVFKPSGSSSHFTSDCRVKTVEKEIPISENYSTFPLFTDNLQRVYLKFDADLDLHVGMIQVALKPTKLGSNTSAIICLRDKRFLEFHDSLLGMVESSLCDGPIYFSYFPTGCVSFSDPHLSSAFTIDIKTQGAGDEHVILMYMFHYKVLSPHDQDPKIFRSMNDTDGIGGTTLFLTDLARSNRVVSKKVYWDQISVPERWMVRSNPLGEEGAAAAANARVDWKETAEAHVLKVDVPGFKKEEVKVEGEDGRILQISGERSMEQEEKNDKWYCMERSSGKFLRRFSLPENAKLGQMKAAVENGVLTVTVPKKDGSEKPEVKVIDVSG